jgi:hypothetical protein
MAKASSRGIQRGVEEEEDLLSTQEVPPWHGEAVPTRATTAPSQGKAPMTRRQDTAPHQQLETKLEVAMAETLGAGGDRAEGTGKQSTRSHGQAGAPSRDLSIATHLVGQLWWERPESSAATVKAMQSPELEGEEKEGAMHRMAGSV